MPLPSTRSWIRVLALFTLIVALTSGFSAYHASRSETPYHAVEARQGIGPSSFVASCEIPAYRVKSRALESWSNRDNQKSRFSQTYGHVLQIKAQPPPYASAGTFQDFQYCASAWCTKQTVVRTVHSIRPIADLRAPQTLHVQQIYSRPPPFLI